MANPLINSGDAVLVVYSLVDKNRETAERLGSWNVRMKWLMGELANLYCVTK